MDQVNEARTVERLSVDSSNIESLGYDVDRQILSIQFKSGSIFHYYSVPLTVFEALGQAPSRGEFYVKNIKRHFSGKPMTGICPECQAKHGLIGEVCEQCKTGIVREVDRQHKP